jgi:DNA-binding transcriptional regulator YdaS (Cro superfamily)
MPDIHQTLYQRRGAVTFVADRLGISIPAVSQWRKRGIPADRLASVEAALAEMDGGPVAQPHEPAQ